MKIQVEVSKSMAVKNIRMLVKQILDSNVELAKDMVDKRKASRLRLKKKQNTWPSVPEVLNQKSVFCLSTGRCGTEFLTHIFKYSKEVVVKHEPKPELEYVSRVIYQNDAKQGELEIAFLAARFDVCLLEAWLRDKIYIETNNRITFFAPAIASLMPNSYFIHLIRDPADFVVSGMRRGYYKKGSGQHQRILDVNSGVTNGSRLELIALEWNEINLKIENFKKSVPSNRVLTINSERLFEDPLIVEKIFDFISIESPYRNAKGRRYLEKIFRNPVNKQSEGFFRKYDDWESSEKEEFSRIVSLSTVYGYKY